MSSVTSPRSTTSSSSSGSAASGRYGTDKTENDKDYTNIRARRTEITDYTSQRLAELRSLRRAESESYSDYKARRDAREAAKDSGLEYRSRRMNNDLSATSPTSTATDSTSNTSSSTTSPTAAPPGYTGLSKDLTTGSSSSFRTDTGPGSFRSESFRLSTDYKLDLNKHDKYDLNSLRTRTPEFKADGEDEYVGFATLPDQVHRKAVKRGFDFTLMVVGESGLGKSTLISSLFLNQNLYQDKKTPTVEDRMLKTVEIKKKHIDIEEKGIKLRLTIVDTPGFNDCVNATDSCGPVIDYINGQFDQYFKDESGLNRKNIQDHRVHCCLYFISPYGHGLRQIDVAFMKRLHGLVNIVPIIAKADTLTRMEVRRLKYKVLEQIEKHRINIYEFPECDSDEDEEFQQQDKELKASIPFAVIGSNTVVEVNGKKVRGRLYPWGIVEVDNPNHCDFSKLRQMLISTHMQDLKDVTRDIHYENFRAMHIKEQMNKQQKERSKLKRDSSPNFESIMDADKKLQQKDEEIRRMQAMLLKMQEQLHANKSQGHQVTQVNGLGNL